MTTLESKRILIIEDNRFNLSIVMTILQQAKAEPIFDWGDCRFLDNLDSILPIDLILLDMMFPQQVTGYDIYERLRDKPELKNVPIVVVTSMDLSTEIARLKHKGFAGYIRKPVKFYQLPHQLSSVLSGENIWVW